MSTAQTETEETPPTVSDAMRLTAIRAFTMRIERLELQVKATKQKYREKLTELTQSMNELIDSDAPHGEEAHERLVEIRDAFKTRETAQGEKKGELSSLKAKIDQSVTARYELIMSEGTEQMTLGFGSEREPWLTKDSARELSLAIQEVEQDSVELSPEMEALRGRLRDMGIDQLRLVSDSDAEEDEEVDDSEDAEEDEEVDDSTDA